MTTDRREALAALATGGLALAVQPTAAEAAQTARPTAPPAPVAERPALEPLPPPPATPPPGQAGDFAFLTGEWRIENWRRLADGSWDAFPAEATVSAILGDGVSIEELRIPARDFAGMGLRLLDRERSVWSDHWVNARSGVVGVPGQEGGFQGGAGIFTSREEVDGKTMIYAGVWDRIAPDSCRWRQAWSDDGGASWNQVWIMHWHRQPT